MPPYLSWIIVSIGSHNLRGEVSMIVRFKPYVQIVYALTHPPHSTHPREVGAIPDLVRLYKITHPTLATTAVLG